MARRKPRPTTDQILRARPFHNEKAEVEHRGKSTMVVSVPLRRPWWLVPPISWVIPFSSKRRVELDALGVEVFDLCDGKHSVEHIIEIFAANHKLSFREAQLPVTQFLEQLTQRGLVAVVGFQEKTGS